MNALDFFVDQYAPKEPQSVPRISRSKSDASSLSKSNFFDNDFVFHNFDQLPQQIVFRMFSYLTPKQFREVSHYKNNFESTLNQCRCDDATNNSSIFSLDLYVRSGGNTHLMRTFGTLST